MSRFQNVSCSQCGRDFGPGDSGFSHCEDHRTLARFDAVREAILSFPMPHGRENELLNAIADRVAKQLGKCAALNSQNADGCDWTEDSDGTWNTDCGHAYCINDGSPADNGMFFCTFCGGKLLQNSYGNQGRTGRTPTQATGKAGCC